MVVLTLLSRTTLSLEDIATIIEEMLGGVVEGVEEIGNEYNYVLQDETVLKVNIPEHVNTNEKLLVQLNGIRNYYKNVKTDKPQIQNSFLQQISLWNSMVCVSFEDTGDPNRLNYIYANIIRTAKAMSGYVMLPELSVLNGDGQLVFSPTGESQLENLHPIAAADSVISHDCSASENDIQRYRKSVSVLTVQGLHCMENMKAALQESEASFRTTEEIACRAIALFAVGVFSECLLSDGYTLEDAKAQVTTLDEQFDVSSYFTRAEVEYMEASKTKFDRQASIQFIWKYECSALLMWSIGLLQELSAIAEQSCNVSKLSETIRGYESVSQMISEAKLRPAEQLLQMQDLMMRYHWVCLECQVAGKPMPDVVNPGVVVERHRALNWLVTQFFGDDWDDIETPA